MKINTLGSTSTTYKVVLLIKEQQLNDNYALETNYINPLIELGIPKQDIIVIGLSYPQAKPTSAQKNSFIELLLMTLSQLKTEYVLCNDAEYYKSLTKQAKAGHRHGILVPCPIKGYEDINIMLGVNYSSFMYDPKQQEKLNTSLNYLANAYLGISGSVGDNVVKYSEFIYESDSVDTWINALSKLFAHPSLTYDIEGYSLNPYKSDVATIGFAWNQHEGIVFALDSEPDEKGYTKRIKSNKDYLLKEFFLEYKGKLIAHKSTFDISVLVARLFMNNSRNNIEGMLLGLDTLTNFFDDSQIILYLATNSTARNELSLKVAAQDYLGDYEQGDIKDITKIPHQQLMGYNLKDVLGTWYIYNKHYPTLAQDNQSVIYESVLKPSVSVIAQMQLVGLPLDYPKVLEAQKTLQSDIANATNTLMNNPYVQQLISKMRYDTFIETNKKWKKKKEPLEYFDYVTYNPSSNDQNTKLIYDVMGFTPTDKTKQGAPSTSNKAIKKLIKLSTEPSKTEVLESLVAITDASIILNNFITAFIEQSVKPEEDPNYLTPYTIHSHYHIGGTVSGRLSSSDINGQNVPSTGSRYSKLIKECVVPPHKYLFAGADFSSLEDRISALTTRDPSKLAIYLKGYDGHCYRAYYYFKDQMPDIKLPEPTDKTYKIELDDGSVMYGKSGDSITLPDGSCIQLT